MKASHLGPSITVPPERKNWGGFVNLTTRGRKTGLPHTVQLRYARLGGSFFVIAGRGDSDWVLNALHEGRATLRVGGLMFELLVERASESERAWVMEEFRRRYGGRLSDQWYAAPRTSLRLTPSGPAIRMASPGELETKESVGEWRTKGIDYYADVAAAFDSASDEYDFTISRNFINTWIRKRSIEVLGRYLRPEDEALEIGCGTGVEALEISRSVKRLVAIDVSQRMVELLQAKVRARHLEGKIIPLRMAAADLPQVKDFLDGSGIRVAYSFNGALNCEPRINEFVVAISRLLLPDGYFVCSVRNTLCLSEVISHSAALQFDRANPRKRQPMMVSVGGRDIPSLYYSPMAFIRLFKPFFKTKEIIALPGLLPPAYLNDYYLKFRSLTSGLERLEPLLGGRFPLNRFGDQTLFVLQKS